MDEGFKWDLIIGTSLNTVSWILLILIIGRFVHIDLY